MWEGRYNNVTYYVESGMICSTYKRPYGRVGLARCSLTISENRLSE